MLFRCIRALIHMHLRTCIEPVTKIKYGSRLHLKPNRNNVCFTLQSCRTFVSKILAQWLRVVKLAFLVKIIVVYAGMG